MAGTPRWRAVRCSARSCRRTKPHAAPDQGILKVSSSPNRLEPRYVASRRRSWFIKPDDVVFETIASCTMVIAALAITALLYQLITVAVPVLKSMVFSQLAAQGASKTLVAVFAHADDEGAAAPILARYARDGAQVYLSSPRTALRVGSTSIPARPRTRRVRAKRLAVQRTRSGSEPPILLGFPDANLGSYVEDPARLFQLTARMQAERNGSARRRDHVGTGRATGHPDHRLVSSIVTQLARAGAAGVPERLFYVSLPVEGFRAMNPARGEPSFLMPLAEVFQRPRSVLRGRLRSLPPIDGLSQDAVLGRNRAKSV